MEAFDTLTGAVDAAGAGADSAIDKVWTLRIPQSADWRPAPATPSIRSRVQPLRRRTPSQ
jgi:hypothetical protein